MSSASHRIAAGYAERVGGFAGDDGEVVHAGVVGLMTVMFWSWSTKKGGSVEPPLWLVTRCYSGVTPGLLRGYSGVTPRTVSIVFRGDLRLPTRQSG